MDGFWVTGSLRTGNIANNFIIRAAALEINVSFEGVFMILKIMKRSLPGGFLKGLFGKK